MRQASFDPSVSSVERRAAVTIVALGAIVSAGIGIAGRARGAESEPPGGRAEEGARAARAIRLAAQSRSLLEDQPQLALLLAAESAEMSLAKEEPIAPECHRALVDALSWVMGLPLLRGENVLAVSPDLKSAAVLRWGDRANGVMLVADPDRAESASRLLFEAADRRRRPEAVFSRDGKRLAVGDGSTLRIYRTASAEAPYLQATARRWTLSPGGEVIAVVDRGILTAWRLGDTKPFELDGVRDVLEGRSESFICSSASGERVLVADWDFERLSLAACDLLETQIKVAARRALAVSGRCAIALHPAGDRFLVADEKAVRLEHVDRADSTMPLNVGPEWDGPDIARFGNTGKSVAIGCDGGRVYWWRLDAAAPVPVVLSAGPSPISHLEFTPDDSHLIAAYGNSLYSWRLGGRIETAGVRHSGHDSLPFGERPIQGLTIGAEPDRFVSVSTTGARIWSIERQSSSPCVELLGRRSLENIMGPYTALSERGDRLLAWYRSSNPEVRDAPKLYALDGNGPASGRIELPAHPWGLWSAAFDASGEMLSVIDDDDPSRVASLATYDLRAKDIASTRRTRFQFDAFYPHTDVSRDRRWLAVIDGLTVRIWDTRKVAAAEEIVPPTVLSFEGKEGKEHGSLWDLLAFSERSTWLAAYSSQAETLAAWKIEEGGLQPRLRVDLPDVTAIVFSTDEKFLIATDFKGKVHVWNMTAAVDPLPSTLPGLSPYDVGERVLTSPDGRWLVATYRSVAGVAVADLQAIGAGATLKRLRDAFGVVAFDPSGGRLLTDSRSQYGRILVWQTKDFAGMPSSVSRGTMDFTLCSLRFSRDGAWLVSSSCRDVTVWPWEKSGPGYVFPYPNAIVEKAELSGDGRWLIVTHHDGVQAWSLDFRALAAAARDRAGRDFTGRERERHLAP